MLADGIADSLAAHHRLAMLPGLLVHADTVHRGDELVTRGRQDPGRREWPTSPSLHAGGRSDPSSRLPARPGPCCVRTRAQRRTTGWTMPARATTCSAGATTPCRKAIRSTPTLPSEPETLSPAGPG